MKYYKHIINEVVVGYVSSPEECVDCNFIPISEEEYKSELLSLNVVSEENIITETEFE